jgi:hypothetical protein
VPFTSRRQQKAAFGGHIPGFSKERAKEWADETDFSNLPDRAPAEKGKRTLRSKEALDFAGVLRRRRERRLQRQFIEAMEADEPTNEKRSGVTPRAVYVAKKLREQLINSGNSKNVLDAVHGEHERSKRKQASDDLVDFCVKIAFAVPKPGQIMGARHVGSFSGQATSNFLKAPGSTTAAVTNPRLSLRNAMTKTMRT